MDLKRRVYVSAPDNRNISDAKILEIKQGVLDRIQALGYEPQEFYESGLCAGTSWNFGRADQVMRRCQGAVLMAFPRFIDSSGGVDIPVPTEYVHFEGALAIAHGVPRLIIAPLDIPNRGICWRGGGDMITYYEPGAGREWLQTPRFENSFRGWREDLEKRPDVFLAYCSKAAPTAKEIREYLESLGVRVMDWALDFMSGGVILDEIHRAARSCQCGVFLFMADDPIVGQGPEHAATRDNVVFEAGFFVNAKSRERVLIVREKGVKMPADLGGVIYEQLNKRRNISKLKLRLKKFIQDRL